MTTKTSRFASLGFVLAGVAFGVEGLLEDKLSYIALGISFLCIAVSMLSSGRGAAGDGSRASGKDVTKP